MRTSIVVAAGLLGAALAYGTGHAEMLTYKATLTAAAEVPPTTSHGTGQALVKVDTETRAISWSVTYAELSGAALAAHIHCGALPGANAGVAVSLGQQLASPIEGTGQMTPAQLANLTAGKCYINIHTAANKGGEIRGQLQQ